MFFFFFFFLGGGGGLLPFEGDPWLLVPKASIMDHHLFIDR